ncbi:peptidoglycan-binding domain-containing protein [Streptomyces sp. MP131-18]|uniref:peptidoglycan-binding domain-containing protein n=1 Tax=Streptomyces sp. MP131-18 TaxID=1857892 RepID=UPI00097BE0F5|nr:peptidoglycan-binding domain-containing protein [Streptomyces sp. MP131-18]ONK14402.1 spore cortex-lytic enzyme [Streptomyces sp. MP131-18]
MRAQLAFVAAMAGLLAVASPHTAAASDAGVGVGVQAGQCTTWKEYRTPTGFLVHTRPPVNGATGSRNCYMGIGASGDGVRALQRALNRCNDASLAVDGQYGRATADAVAAEQRAEDIPVDGEYGPETRRAMGWPSHNDRNGSWNGRCVLVLS